MRKFTTAIVGGGASGTLVAAFLVERSATAKVAIVDPCEQLGRGLAYATDCAQHVLNIPAGKMSARPSEPDHFVRWLASNVDGSYGRGSFVPRSLYGDYLGGIARDARASAPDRWRHVRALATDAIADCDGVRVSCSNGETIDADVLVVATGNAAPAAWPGVSAAVRRSRRSFDSAWTEGATRPGSPDETVLVLGMGLTAVDAVFGLRSNGHRGPIYMVSRRGLLPHEHRVFDAPPSVIPDAHTIAELLDAVRTRVREVRPTGVNWRGVVDDVRPHTNALWKALSLEEQRRFFRHAAPYWNVHRHRIAPERAKELAELRAAGTLRVVAGRTGEIVARGDLIRVSIRLRGSGDLLIVDAARLINCSGPQHDVRKLSNPLIASLLARGSMLSNPLGIGVRVAEDGALVGTSGPSKSIFAIGPARFGTLIETTAIPEIREQARDLARAISAAECGDRGERLAG